MKRFLSILPYILILLFIGLAVTAQSNDAVPTLVSPTLVPTVASANTDSLLTESAVASIQQSDVFRVGILYNEPPYGELSVRGDIRGFDAELASLIAETWEVELEFRQVTRQNALEMLNSGAVDAVFSAFIHHRSYDTEVEFSQSYLIGRQSMMVLADSDVEAPTALINRPVGYVIGARAEQALQQWGKQLGLPLNSQFFVTLDLAYVALAQGEIDGVIGEHQRLLWVSRNEPDLTRLLDEPISVEPHAIAVRRQDVNMRNLLNRTIQFLADDGQIEILFSEYFSGQDYPEDLIYLWDEIGESPKPSEFETNVPYPQQYAMARILNSGVMRVAGIIDLPENPTESDLRMDVLNRLLANEIAGRWDISVEFVSSTPEMGVDMIRNGQADLVMSIQPNWRFTDTIDYTTPYLLHGDRLMVPANSNVEGFNELRGQWIGVMIGDDTGQQRAKAWADSINATVNFYQTLESDAALTILEQDNADVIYSNSLSLIPHLEASPNALRLTDRWYSRRYFGIGVSRNDIDFRLLVDYTIQQLITDGTLERLSSSLILSDELPLFDIWPGDASYMGINLSP
jgi:ABC-type amino acid transport substrate-binding protein